MEGDYVAGSLEHEIPAELELPVVESQSVTEPISYVYSILSMEMKHLNFKRLDRHKHYSGRAKTDIDK